MTGQVLLFTAHRP